MTYAAAVHDFNFDIIVDRNKRNQMKVFVRLIFTFPDNIYQKLCSLNIRYVVTFSINYVFNTTTN